jgi:hypothetical protein
MNLYIAGDSYCADRTDPVNHWPAILAQLLGLQLQGAGFPGLGWWPVRQNLEQYLRTTTAKNTTHWIFCHTDPHRPITDHRLSELSQRAWVGEIHNTLVSNWCATQWYQELNGWLQGQQVIHLICYPHSATSSLVGYQRPTPLFELAKESAGNQTEFLNHVPNHFCGNYNQRLAQELAQTISQIF